MEQEAIGSSSMGPTVGSVQCRVSRPATQMTRRFLPASLSGALALALVAVIDYVVDYASIWTKVRMLLRWPGL
jgi:hypothetical protein